MLNTSYPLSSSSSSLKRSISTPGTLFALRSFNSSDIDSIDFGGTRISTAKYGEVNSSFKILNKITPEELARQLTLIDWSIFVCITRNELKSGQWTGPMKHVLSPNVVAFTRRFNVLTNWISDEILSIKQPKQRADMISYFIKVCNHLIEIKNLYSSYAIFGALTSEPIYRLEKTWANLAKKDKQSFDRISSLFSQSDNSIKLRNFMDEAVNSPNVCCIPHLAIILRDIIHIDNYFRGNDPDKMRERAKKLEWNYNFIETCQQSNYDFIELIEPIYDFLRSFNYIDELQKFRDDEYYKISMKLEPIDASKSVNNVNTKSKLYQSRFNSTYDIRSQFYVNDCDLSLEARNARTMLNKSMNEDLFFRTKYTNTNSSNIQDSTLASTGFKPGHRKTSSLEAGSALAVANKSNSLGKRQNLKLNLIDDSPSYDVDAMLNYAPHNGSSHRDHRKPTLELKLKKANGNGFNHLDSSSYSNEDDASSLDEHNENTSKQLMQSYTHRDLLHSGYVGRKTVLKLGKKQSIKFWVNYFIGVTENSLLFFNPKAHCQSPTFCSKPIKSLPLTDWSVGYMDDCQLSDKKNVFTLADSTCSNVYKIKTASESEAREWVRVIHQVIGNMKNMYLL